MSEMSTPEARRLSVQRFPARTMPALLVHTARRVPGRVFLDFLDPAAGAGAPPRQLRFSEFRDLVARGAAFLESAGVRQRALAEQRRRRHGVSAAADN